jgi:hypothetical protein
MEHAPDRPVRASRSRRRAVARALVVPLAAVGMLSGMLGGTGAAAPAHIEAGRTAVAGGAVSAAAAPMAGVPVSPGRGPAAAAPTGTAATPGRATASAASTAAAPCRDAYPIGRTGYIRYGRDVVASVKQYYSRSCRQNWGYVWVWESFRDRKIPYDVGVAVYSYTAGGPYGSRSWTNTRRAAFWSAAADTRTHCTSGQGHLVINNAVPAEEYSSKRC